MGANHKRVNWMGGGGVANCDSFFGKGRMIILWGTMLGERGQIT